MEHVGTKDITSERLLLRRFNQEDAKEIYNGFVNQSEFLYYTNKKQISLEDEIISLRDVDERYKNKDYYNWLITLKDTREIIGAINLKVNLDNESVMFNYAIDNRFVCKGYMTEALNAIKRYAFEQIKVNRFEGGCVIENIASRRVMEKCGLLQERILKKHIKLKDGYHDMYLFGLGK